MWKKLLGLLGNPLKFWLQATSWPKEGRASGALGWLES